MAESTDPKIVTRRKELLAELAENHLNRCLKGHLNCAIPEHYAFEESKKHVGVQKERVPLRDKDGIVLRDPQGDVLYTWVDKLATESRTFKHVYYTYDDGGSERPSDYLTVIQRPRDPRYPAPPAPGKETPAVPRPKGVQQPPTSKIAASGLPAPRGPEVIDYTEAGSKAPTLIQDWQKADAAKRARLLRQEDEARHSREPRSETRTLLTLRGDALRENNSDINREIFYDKQPVYTLISFGLDPKTRHPFAKIKLNQLNESTFVDLTPALAHMTKNKRKRVMRLASGGKIDEAIFIALNRAIKPYVQFKR